jgi:phage terminase Nu1 subunit (DNA packaging protein)
VTALPSAVHAPAPVERYVDAKELAALMGVSTRTITRFVAEGMPSENWGMSRTRRFLPSKAIAWARARSSTILASRDRDYDAPDQPQPKE